MSHCSDTGFILFSESGWYEKVSEKVTEYFFLSPRASWTTSETISLPEDVSVTVYFMGGNIILHDDTHDSSNTRALSVRGRYSYSRVPESFTTNDSWDGDEKLIVLVFL